MRQKILLYILFLFIGEMLYGQSFPVVITNTYQATGTNPLNLHIGSVASGNITTFQVNTKLVANAAVNGPTATSPSNGSVTSYWWQVDLPGTTAGVTAYCAAGATFTNPICNSSYITITAPSANISKTAGGTAFVTISGATAKGFQGQHFGWNSSQTVGGVNWYQVGLPDNCSQATGWISAASASLTNTNGSGLPAPVLSATVSGNSVDLSWTMNIQPTGTAQTVFTLYKSVNGGTPVPINIPTAPPDTYVDNNYSSSNSYTYYIQAGYGICTLLNSNTVNLPATVSSNGHIQVNISPVGINASWSLDGSGAYSSGANIAASFGSHIVSFSPVAGYTAPANQTINLSGANANPSINVTYTPAVACNYPPPPTGGTSVTISPTQIDLAWQRVTGASYRIYDCNGGYIGSSNTTSYQATGLQAATLYSYKLTSINSQGCESQAFSPCFSSTTMSGAAITYTVSGKITTSVGNVLPGVTVTTGIYSAVTDANGNYLISNIPAIYAGTVSASLSGYTFSPSSHTVTATDNVGKDFIANPITSPKIAISGSSVIPPWQREGEAFAGKLSVNYSDFSIGNRLQLDIYVNGQFAGTVATYSVPGANGTTDLPFNITTNNLTVKPRAGQNVGYQVICATNSVHQNATSFTAIIAPKLDLQTVAFYNGADKDDAIKIPVHWDAAVNFQNVTISFTRAPRTAAIGTQNIPQLFSEPPTLTVSNMIAVVGTGYFTVNLSNSNLKDIYPGEFTYQIKNNTQALESGTFSLVKVGRMTNADNNSGSHLIVGIGGIYNVMEQSVNELINTDDDPKSVSSFSILRYIAYRSDANIWYIAQGNVNSIRRNGYDIGVALEKIISLTSVSEIDLVCHSKGGLDARAFIQNQSIGLDNSSKNFALSPVSGLLKKVVFLGTPHRGSEAGGLVQAFLTDYLPITWYALNNFIVPKGVSDLTSDNLLKPTSALFSLNLSKLPNSIMYANLTGFVYNDPVTDGWVEVTSSEYPTPDCLQLYQNYAQHLRLHKNLYLSTAGECVQIDYNIDKLLKFIQGNYSSVQTCQRNILGFKFAPYGSSLPGANISQKALNSTNYLSLGRTDESGSALLQPFTSFSIGDSVKIEAAGYETASLPIDQNLLNTQKLPIGMFKSNVPTALIKYPALKLTNPVIVSSVATVVFTLSGDNVLKYEINKGNSFIPLNINNQSFSVQLDTGANDITVRLIGAQDTVELSKRVYYYPGAMLDSLSIKVNLSVAGTSANRKLYVDNNFYGELPANTIIRLPVKSTQLKVTCFGYLDKVITVTKDTSVSIVQTPYTYASATDSVVINFANGINPQYWKSISLKNISPNAAVHLSVQQYEESFNTMALQSASRSFRFNNLTTDSVSLRTAIALDQAVTPNIDSVYLLSIKDGKYTKYRANVANLSEYDPIVQKLAFDSVRLKAKGVQEIALMRKLAPILLNPQSLEIVQCKQQDLPVSSFVANPDSIKNDLVVTCSNPNVTVNGNALHINAPFGTTGSLSFALSFTHDFITVSKTFSVMINPCPITPPNAFTPNGDGINDTWDIPNLTNFPNCTVDVFNRYGNLVYHSVGYGKAWNGSYNGQHLPAGVYYYIIEPKEPGYKTLTGNITIVR